jgi:hypothetical protein
MKIAHKISHPITAYKTVHKTAHETAHKTAHQTKLEDSPLDSPSQPITAHETAHKTAHQTTLEDSPQDSPSQPITAHAQTNDVGDLMPQSAPIRFAGKVTTAAFMRTREKFLLCTKALKRPGKSRRETHLRNHGGDGDRRPPQKLHDVVCAYPENVERRVWVVLGHLGQVFLQGWYFIFF